MNTTSVLLVVLATLLLNTYTSHGVRIASEKRLLPYINRIYLHCVTDANNDQDLTNPVTFYRTIVNDQGQVTSEPFAVESTGLTEFNITSGSEGIFTCVDNSTGQVSSNNISLVAFPYINSTTFTLPRERTVSIGHTSPPLYCGFRLGALPQYYEIEWWRGTAKLDTTNISSRYKVLENLTLEVQDTQISDASSGYFCILKVINPAEGVVYNNTSPDISLQVYNPLTLTSSLSDTAITIGQSASFTCTAHGVPQPNIRWKISNNRLNNPRYSIQEQVSSTSLVYTVTSTLTLTDATLTDTGGIECIGYSNNEDGLNIDTNTANLVVLDTPSVPILVPDQNHGVSLTVSFPSVIPVFFLVHIRYISTADTNNNYETVLASPLFTNTSMITNYNIPSHNLPTFSSFRAQVALQVFGIKGQYSAMSSITELLDPLPTSSPSPTIITSTARTCSNTCTDNISLYLIIALLTTVLIILLICLAGMVLYYCIYKNKLKEGADNHQSTLPVAFRSNNYEIKLPSGNEYAIPDKNTINSPVYSGTCTSCGDDTTCTCSDHTCTSPSGGTHSMMEERKSVSDTPPVIYVNVEDVTLQKRNNPYDALEAAIEPLASEPKVIKATEIQVVMEDSSTNKDQEVNGSLPPYKVEEKDEEEKTAGRLSQPKLLYNDSLTSSQGNIPALFTPYDHTSHSISAQTDMVPSFSKITNPSPSVEEQRKEKEVNADGSDIMTKSVTKMLKGYEIIKNPEGL